MARSDPLAAAIRRDRAILLVTLIGLGGLAWAFMIRMSAAMGDGHSCHVMASPLVGSWGGPEILMAFSMWMAMMVAMMLPIVTPWLLVLSGTKREKDPGAFPLSTAGFFLLGYAVIWVAYSALATLGQWGLGAAALLSPALVGTSPVVGGVLLLAAGIYQWTPWRDACMTHCRSPLGFFATSWKEGRRGAFTMGLRHGLYCVGCCWALMALSFVFGVMNLLWMAGLTVFLLAEKVTSWGPWFGKAAGAILAGYGLWMLVRPIL
jgi:predicted metal-binding membrane protein